MRNMNSFYNKLDGIYLIFVLLCIFVVNATQVLTESQTAAISVDIAAAFALTNSYGTACNSKITPCPIGDNIGALLRLAFHDATGNGGPNGCIDFLTTSDNNGLQTPVLTLNTLYDAKGYKSIISKADLYVLAAQVAIKFASTTPSTPSRPGGGGGGGGGKVTLDPSPGTLTLPFRYGRVDALSCNDTGALPDANYDWIDMKNLFGGRFGMSIKEMVAIMGGHSVGRCTFSESGFDGGWTPFQSSFSNQYFKAMGTILWKNLNTSDIWIDTFPGGPESIMLKPDVELLFQTYSSPQGYCSSFNSFTPTARCPLQSQSITAFNAYMDPKMGNTYFYGNFSSAWQKMTEYSYSEGRLASVGTSLAAGVVYPSTVGGTTSPTVAPSGPSTPPSPQPTSAPTLPPTPLPTTVPTARPSGPSPKPTTTPTLTPSLPPVTIVAPGSSNSNNDNSGGCFAGTETIELESGAIIAIADARIGDRIRAARADGTPVYSAIVSVPHGRNNERATFVELLTSSGGSLRLTTGHFVLASSPSSLSSSTSPSSPSCSFSHFRLVKAEDVVVGSYLIRTASSIIGTQTPASFCRKAEGVAGGEMRPEDAIRFGRKIVEADCTAVDVVVSKRAVVGQGLYTVVAQEPFIVVNGFLSSPFSGNHAVVNAFYNIHRVLYRLLSRVSKTLDIIDTAAGGVVSSSNDSPSTPPGAWLVSAIEIFGDFVSTVS